MSGGGGKGGSQTSETKIPDWIKEPSERAIARGEDISKMGYMDYMGPDVAALSQPQMDAMYNTSGAANAFGMAGGDPMAGMPAPQTFGGGMQGYSSFPMFDEARNTWAAANPGQADYYSNFFIDPQAGGLLEEAPTPAAPRTSYSDVWSNRPPEHRK